MRIETRADQVLIEGWVKQFPLEELTANGWTAERLSELVQTYPGFFLFQQENLAACLIYQCIDINHFEVLYLGTIPSMRRKGFQESLLQHLAKAYPGGKLWLECRADNEAALKLYKKSGFMLTGRRPKYYNDGMDALLMELFF